MECLRGMYILGLSLGLKEVFPSQSYVHDNICSLSVPQLFLESYLRGCLDKPGSPVLTESPPEMT